MYFVGLVGVEVLDVCFVVVLVFCLFGWYVVGVLLIDVVFVDVGEIEVLFMVLVMGDVVWCYFWMVECWCGVLDYVVLVGGMFWVGYGGVDC